MPRNVESICRNCWWLSDEYTSVCVNEASPHCADFVLLNQSCPHFDLDERKAKTYKRPRSLPLMEEQNDEQ